MIWGCRSHPIISVCACKRTHFFIGRACVYIPWEKVYPLHLPVPPGCCATCPVYIGRNAHATDTDGVRTMMMIHGGVSLTSAQSHGDGGGRHVVIFHVVTHILHGHTRLCLSCNRFRHPLQRSRLHSPSPVGEMRCGIFPTRPSHTSVSVVRIT